MSADILMTYSRALEHMAERFMGEALSPDKQTPECVCVLADGSAVPPVAAQLLALLALLVRLFSQWQPSLRALCDLVC